MEVVSISSLPTGSLLWQTQARSSMAKAASPPWFLTVVCKATYVLAPSESPLAPEQEPLNEDDTYWDDDPARSLHSATDLVPFKTRADVLLVGHAFAPNKRAVRSLITRLVVNEVDKSIEAVCDRYFSLDGKLHEGSPFTRMPLSYERALGGPGTSNPVGVRRDARDAYGISHVPNLQPPGVIVASPADVFDPIGYGPVAPIWPTRREKLGRHAGITSQRALLEGPLPEDIDATFWNAAPLDQLVGALRNNERLVLENLHPEHARLVTSLPGIGPRAFVDGRAGGLLEMPMTADTLFIDTDMGICSMTWRGSFQLEHPNERGRVVVGMDQPGKPLTWSEAKRALDRQENRQDNRHEKSAPSSPSERRQRPDIDIANAKEATRESTSTYVGGAPKAPERRITALPFAKNPPASPGVSAPPGLIPPPGSAQPPPLPPLPPRPAPSSAAAVPAPPPPASHDHAAEVDDFEEVDPFQDTTGTFVESLHGLIPGGTVPGAKKPSMPGLPFSTPEPKAPPPSHAAGLPFVAPPQSPRLGVAAPKPPPVTPLPPSSAPMPAAVLPQAPAPPSPPALAPPPLYIAESMGSWGTAQPPPSLGATPVAAPPPVVEPPHAWDAPSRIVPPPTSAAPPTPAAPLFRAPAAPAAPPPPTVVDSPWATGVPPPLPARQPMPSSPLLGGAPLGAPALGVASIAVSSLGAPSIGPAPAIVPAPSDAGLGASKEAPDAAVLVASNAAAGKSGPWYPPRPKDLNDDDLVPASDEAPKAEAKPNDRDLIELLWYEPSHVPRMRRQAAWRELLDELENRPADADIEETSPYRSAAEAEDRRDVFEIIARGQSSDGERLNGAIEKAIRDDRKFIPPLVLVTGDLAFPFDEAEMLKAYIAAATPLATGDENLKSSIALAKEFLGAPGLTGAPGVAEGLIARIREAFGMAKRPVPADYLEAQTSRALLEKRCYQRREVFGGPFLRGLYHTSAVTGVSAQALAAAPAPGAPNPNPGGARSPAAGGSAATPPAPGQPVASGPMPTYLPDALAKSLPLFQRFRVRLIAEVHLAVDQSETHPLGLKVVALARAVERPILK